MKVEILLYVYLAVCLSMIVFNIVHAVVLKRRDVRTERVSAGLERHVRAQIERAGADEKHLKYMMRKLRRVGNMIAFDKMLEPMYIENAGRTRDYLYSLDSVIIALTAYYSGRGGIEAAYFPYIIKKYRLIAHRPFPSITGTLISMLRSPSIYCRENAMQALYTTGDADCIMEALTVIDSSSDFYHGKMLSDGLLNFAGSARELNGKITAGFDGFSPSMQVVLLNYLRFCDSGYGCFAYGLLRDGTRDDEVRYACIRYLGKFPLEEARDYILSLAECTDAARWEYAAIASSALAAYPGEKTEERLKQNLYSPNWYIRLNSADSLDRQGFTYEKLADVIDGKDRYASEMLRYRLERARIAQGART